MSNAPTRTLLSLDRFFQVMGVNPLHASQVTDAAMPNTVCSAVMKTYAWQHSDAVSREDIAQAIQEAESRIADYVGYTLAPAWQVDERVQTVKPGMTEVYNLSGRDLRGFSQSVQLARGHFISGGIEAKTSVESDSPIVYSDEDGDGYFETATVTAATTLTDTSEIAVYYPLATAGVWLPGGEASDAWEIRPLRSVSISGGVATIKMWRHQLVIPLLLEALVPGAVDGADDDNFLPSVDVYRHWNDPQQQAQMLWSPLGGCACNGLGTCETCEGSAQYGCLLASDHRLGIAHYQPATWDADTDGFTGASFAGWRNPDRLRVWYYAGLPAPMDGAWERAIAYYAVTLLDRTLCSCSNVEMIVKHWRTEMNLNESDSVGSSSYQLGRRVLDNPFGQTRGALFAFDRASANGRRIGKAVVL